MFKGGKFSVLEAILFHSTSFFYFSFRYNGKEIYSVFSKNLSVGLTKVFGSPLNNQV
jgi:hypothetical protein